MASSSIGRPIKKPGEGKTKNARSDLDYSTEEAARAIKCLDKGASLVATALECGIHPRVMKSIATDYADLKEALILSSTVVREIEKLPLEGNMPFKSDRDLLEAIKNAVAPCPSCGKQERALCKQCAATKAAPTKAVNGVNGEAPRRKAG